MSLLLHLDHIVDRLLCVDASAKAIQQQYVLKAIALIKTVDANTIFGKVEKMEDPRMFGLDYTDYVERGRSKIFFKLSLYYGTKNNPIGFKLYMTLGFFTKKHSIAVYDQYTEQIKTANVRALLNNFK